MKFSKRFIKKVKNGQKLTTIRGGINYKVGEILKLCDENGQEFKTIKCGFVAYITIFTTAKQILINGDFLNQKQIKLLVKKEGFNSEKDFFEFFKTRLNRVSPETTIQYFHGQLIGLNLKNFPKKSTNLFPFEKMNLEYKYCLDESCIHRRGCKRWVYHYEDYLSKNQKLSFVDSESCQNSKPLKFAKLDRFRLSNGDLITV